MTGGLSPGKTIMIIGILSTREFCLREYFSFQWDTGENFIIGQKLRPNFWISYIEFFVINAIFSIKKLETNGLILIIITDKKFTIKDEKQTNKHTKSL